MENTMTRRSFISFVLLGGFVGFFFKKFKTGKADKKAMFWRKRNEG